MKRRAFTLIELLIVVAIICIIAAIAIPLLVSRASTSVSTPITPVPANKAGPERGSGYHVHNVTLENGLSLLSTRVNNSLVDWLRQHPDHRIVEVVNTDDGHLIIISETR